MWLWLSLCSAVLLGFYDVAKKQALKRNSVLWILLFVTGLSALLLAPCLKLGTIEAHLSLAVKSLLVSCSWISGLVALRLLPLTTVSTIKASRPMFVVLLSILIFQERLSLSQWGGVALIMTALLLLACSSRKEGIVFTHNRGIAWMVISVLAGAASALYDKHILQSMEPLFVQSWTNVYTTVLLGILLTIRVLRGDKEAGRFSWDWRLLLIAVLITVSDALYFYSLSREGALLSVISMIRRCSVVIVFVAGALFFKEHNIRDKALALALMLAGVVLLLY